MKIWRHLNLKENISRPILLTNGWLGIGLGGRCGGAFGIVNHWQNQFVPMPMRRMTMHRCKTVPAKAI